MQKIVVILGSLVIVIGIILMLYNTQTSTPSVISGPGPGCAHNYVCTVYTNSTVYPYLINGATIALIGFVTCVIGALMISRDDIRG